MIIAVYGRPGKDNTSQHIQQLFDKLESLNIQVLVHDTFYNHIKQYLKLSAGVKRFSKHEHLKGVANFLLSIGGDGTLLETISLVRDSVIPILGINTGRLGFLANVSKDEIDGAINALINDKYNIDRRTLLHLETGHSTFGELNFALNEMTVHARESSMMMTIHTYINGEYLNSYWADGLIVATPTGSTAYSLSCGGPIIIPDSKSFIITPIAPHNLNARPLVISDNDIVTLKIEGRSNSFMVSLDSRSAMIDSTSELTVSKEKFQINLVRLDNQKFIHTLRNKLMWGVDKRN
ncbi:MAG: NAD kinase [Bacteroidetes bacterium]|nr:NAD kinase [Bacteroidota bacterium]